MPINEHATATAEDCAAKREALEMGLVATKPLSAARLAQLCLLGERMRLTALRKRDAERDVDDATVQMARRLDIPLPL